MKNTKINNLLIVCSLFVLISYSIIVIVELLNEGEISMVNLSSIFGNVIVTTIFILDKRASKDFKVSKLTVYLLKFLIIFSVVFSGVLLNELISVGLLAGKELFWQLATIFLALGAIILIQTTQQRRVSN